MLTIIINSWQRIENIKLLHYKNTIYIPPSLSKAVYNWYYYKTLIHAGTSKLEATLIQIYWLHNLCNEVKSCCKYCHMRQLAKMQRKKYRKLPAKQTNEVIWNRVKVNVWGPGTIDNRKGWQTQNALDGNDSPAVNCWFEVLAPIHGSQDSFECKNHIFDDMWLSRYPIS